MKLGNLQIQQADHAQGADALIIVVPMNTVLLPLLLLKRTAHFLQDVTYWLMVNVFAGSEVGYVVLHKR